MSLVKILNTKARVIGGKFLVIVNTVLQWILENGYWNDQATTPSTIGLDLRNNLTVLSNTTANLINTNTGLGKITLDASSRTFAIASGAIMNVAWVIVGRIIASFLN